MGRKALTVEAANKRLEAAQIGLRLFQRGEKLSLRGTLPPRPGSKKDRPSQQLIRLGVYANPAGIEFAEAEAYRLGALLAQKRFDWRDLDADPNEKSDTCESWIERFKKDWLKQQEGDEEAISVRWREQFWYPAFKWLPPNAKLTAHLLDEVSDHWKPNTRSRQIACQKFQRLADFAGIASTVRERQGDYRLSNVQRVIPDDKDIIAAIDGMKNTSWQWIAAMMATYNLRDHEAFLCDVEWRDYDGQRWLVALVPDGTKTGRRETFPLPPEWVDRWELWEVRRPSVTVRVNKDYGDRTSTAFQRAKMPFPPYSLRHAWSLRAALWLELPTAVASQFMGHNPNVNLGTYQKHISKERAAQSYFAALKKKQSV
jgi:integrase